MHFGRLVKQLMRGLAILTVCIGAIAPVTATTLEQLSLGEMAQQSTSIVRAKVLSANAVPRGGNVYTVYRVETLESLKAPRQRPAVQELPGVQELAVPGGVAAGIRQVMAGAPALRVGGEYVLFLWTGRSGLTQIMGLSQGLFSVEAETSEKDALLTRVAAGEPMLDGSGHPVRDATLALRWTELKAQVRQALQSRPLAAKAAAGSR